jgi:hypothetical protein
VAARRSIASATRTGSLKISLSSPARLGSVRELIRLDAVDLDRKRFWLRHFHRTSSYCPADRPASILRGESPRVKTRQYSIGPLRGATNTASIKENSRSSCGESRPPLSKIETPVAVVRAL